MANGMRSLGRLVAVVVILSAFVIISLLRFHRVDALAATLVSYCSPQIRRRETNLPDYDAVVAEG